MNLKVAMASAFRTSADWPANGWPSSPGRTGPKHAMLMLAPWVLLPTIVALRGSSGRSVRALAAQAGLAVALMGAVNAIATLAGCLPAVIWWACHRPNRLWWRYTAWWLLGEDLSAVFAHQGFNFHGIEETAREHETGIAGARLGIDARDDPLDVGFEVDACELLELTLAVVLRLRGHGLTDTLTEIGRHDLSDLDVRDDRGRGWHVPELFGSVAVEECRGGKSDVVGDEAGAEADHYHQQRNDDEVAGFDRHSLTLET